MFALRQARLAGLFYVGTTIFGVLAVIANGKIIVGGDAAATAGNITSLEGLYRAGVASNLVAAICYVIVTLLLYRLLRPVNPSVSLLAALFSTVGVAAGAAATIVSIAPLLLLGGPHYLAAMPAAQLDALAYVFVRLSGQGSLVSLVFFGCYCALLGYLIFRSGFLPRWLGSVMVVAGACYLIYTFASFLSPPFAGLLSNFILYPTILGETALALWLLMAGIRVAPLSAPGARMMDTPNKLARLAGALYLLAGLPTFFSLMRVLPSLIVTNDAAATAARIVGAESLYRLAMVSELVGAVAFIFPVLVLHRLLRGVNRDWASLMVTLFVLSVPLSFVAVLNEIAALTLFKGGGYLAVLNGSQLDALGFFFQRLHGNSIALASVFWGLWLFPFGMLVYKSGFLPKVLGVLLMLSCIGYVGGTVAPLSSPALHMASDYGTALGGLGELAIVLWLLIVGVRKVPAAA